MDNIVFENGCFKVFFDAKADKSPYVLINTSLPYGAHTHLDSRKQAEKLIQLSKEKRIPRDLSRYLLISLARINEGEYRKKIMELVENKARKQKFVNVNKGICRGIQE